MARLCSRNEHKRVELARVLHGWRIELLGAAEFPPEDGATFLDNARARPTADASARGTSGCSARTRGSSCALCGAARASRLRGGRVDTMSSAPWRPSPARPTTPRATSASSLRSPSGRGGAGRGTLDGQIVLDARGDEGFGFDPVFVPDGEERTVAELGDAWKAEHSHRAPQPGAFTVTCRVRTDGESAAATDMAGRGQLPLSENELPPGNRRISRRQTLSERRTPPREPPVELGAEHDDIRHQIEPDEEDDGTAERLEAGGLGRSRRYNGNIWKVGASTTVAARAPGRTSRGVCGTFVGAGSTRRRGTPNVAADDAKSERA